jgi:hypothetical protein
MRVLLELIRTVVKTMKIIKLHETHSMAMVYKTISGHVNDNVDKIMILWSKSKLQYAKINKNNKMVMPFDNNTKVAMALDKRNNVVRNKTLKHNVLFEKLH